MSQSSMFKCNECNAEFFQKRYLKMHVNRKHVDKTGNMLRSTELKNECEICDKMFSCKQSLSKHKISIHNVKIKDKHAVSDDGINLKFNCEQDFNEWLVEEEKKTMAHFVLARGEKVFKNHRVRSYKCHRSGFYKSKGIGKRQLKAQGSWKLNKDCSASLTVKVFDNKVEVIYFKVHNHEATLGHLPLPASVKDTIAEKVLSGVNDTRILRDIRGDVEGDAEERHHLLTRKDLNNVKSSIGSEASKVSFVSSDELSVKVWVESMKGNILCYKEQNTDHPCLDSQDFCLSFMMPLQKKMLSDFGCDRICIDSTHGTTGYGFELTTVMVIDEYEEGFPVAFCLSSRVNRDTLKYFFQCIQQIVDINAQVFMSDDAPFIYEAWADVFGAVEKRLLCSWHVDRAWQGHLNCITKEKKELVYKFLKTLTYELDPSLFNLMLCSFLEELRSDPETVDFYNYFQTYYVNRVEMWAYCFRKTAKLNTNMHLEHFHQELKHIYLEGKKSKRVDKCCEALRKYILDKKYERLIKIHKGKITKKHTKSFKRHKEGVDLVDNCIKIKENEWQIKSKNSNYTVIKLHECNSSCNLLCRACYCCLQSHTCTCLDFCILNNLCKHIHATKMSYSNLNYIGPLNKMSRNTQFNRTITSEPKVKVKSNDSNTKILNEINRIQNKVLSINDIPEPVASEVLKALKNVNILLDINTPTTKLPKTEREPANKRIAPQNRFFSIKKQRSKKKRLGKPQSDEQSSIKSVLLKELIVSKNPNLDHNYL